jgi:hypothetical protein
VIPEKIVDARRRKVKVQGDSIGPLRGLRRRATGLDGPILPLLLLSLTLLIIIALWIPSTVACLFPKWPALLIFVPWRPRGRFLPDRHQRQPIVPADGYLRAG